MGITVAAPIHILAMSVVDGRALRMAALCLACALVRVGGQHNTLFTADVAGGDRHDGVLSRRKLWVGSKGGEKSESGAVGDVHIER